MTYIRPKFRHPELPKNKLGYSIDYYEGALSTLCAGCGHDSISAGVIQACFEMDIEPHKLAKLSGIGCSSKTPAYFLSNSQNCYHSAWLRFCKNCSDCNFCFDCIGCQHCTGSACLRNAKYVWFNEQLTPLGVAGLGEVVELELPKIRRREHIGLEHERRSGRCRITETVRHDLQIAEIAIININSGEQLPIGSRDFTGGIARKRGHDLLVERTDMDAIRIAAVVEARPKHGLQHRFGKGPSRACSAGIGANTRRSRSVRSLVII